MYSTWNNERWALVNIEGIASDFNLILPKGLIKKLWSSKYLLHIRWFFFGSNL